MQLQQCKANNFASAASIAEPLLLKAIKANTGATLPGFHAIAAAGNRIRSKSRPKHPKDRFFDLDTRNLPKKFFRKEFIVGRREKRRLLEIHVKQKSQLEASVLRTGFPHVWRQE
ncbi:hypothetical protein DAPPUDRAFT_113643 [Daphnia pulex]|uniref:Uncharacterized protein n=1 Tax=Daphnia pulex TaxID=6669 RepID=E9HFM5_DAPPU|nr:hypothetical protein DAPPUDRAFT_113643 [Daphnia pulex]|eukprot:EFX69455.1 hypothetical protein DAPPUDRAFT_113643 [Daphnia pulex]